MFARKTYFNNHTPTVPFSAQKLLTYFEICLPPEDSVCSETVFSGKFLRYFARLCFRPVIRHCFLFHYRHSFVFLKPKKKLTRLYITSIGKHSPENM